MQSDLDYIMRSFSLSRTKAEGVKLGKPQSIHRNHPLRRSLAQIRA